jgi:hypothetical protein
LHSAATTFRSVVPCAGIQTRSDQSVTSGASLPVVHARPESQKVVHPRWLPAWLPAARPAYIPRRQQLPLRPELAALLGVRPSSQLAWCAGGRAGWRLSGDVAVLLCCTAPAPLSRASVVVPTSRPSLFRPDIAQVATDRASVLRCRRSLPIAVGRCCCCHRCCQPRSAERVAGREWAGRVLAAYLAEVFR